MMKELDWVTLDDRWKHQLLVMTLKWLKQIAPDYISSLFTFTHSAHNISTRSQSSNILMVPPRNIAAAKRTFQYRAATIWNMLPVHIRCNFFNMSLNEFKNAM